MLRAFATTRTVGSMNPEAHVGQCPHCGHDALFLRFVEHDPNGERMVTPWRLDHCSGGCPVHGNG